MRLNGCLLRQYDGLKTQLQLNTMKKSTKLDKSTTILTPKKIKIPVLTHSIGERAILKPDPSDSSERQVNVVCPNCEFHFKVELRLLDRQRRSEDAPAKPDASLERLIEHEFSLISNYSRDGTHIQNSPILRLKNKEHADPAFAHSEGLERLQKLNEFSELQKSRLHDSKLTVRFNPSPKDSPAEQPHKSIRLSPPPQIHPKTPEVTHSPSKAAEPKQLSSEEGRLMREMVFSYWEMVETLTAMLEWARANEHYDSLPSYLRLLVGACQEKLNAAGLQ